jgi:23S rRNA pseudouridine1911/1915/1917 synthase
VYEDGSIGKHAVTHYDVVKRYKYVTLIKCKLETGRTHQIRVHMKHIGHTLFNDTEYGGNTVLKGNTTNNYKTFVENCFSLIPGQALHAKSLGFEHPYTKERMYFESELPMGFLEILEKWEKIV